MTKNIFIITLLSLMLFTWGCNESNEVPFTPFENAIAIATYNDEYVLVNEQRQHSQVLNYDEVLPFFNEVLVVKKDGLYGYINNDGTVLISPMYDMAFSFTNDSAVVKKGNNYLLINKENNILHTFDENITINSSFVEGLLVVEKNGKYAYMNEDFEYITDFEYDYASNVQDNYVVVGNFKLSTLKYGMGKVNKNSISLITDGYEYDFLDHFYDGLARMAYGTQLTYKYGYIDTNNNRLRNSENKIVTYDYATNFSEEMAVVSYNDEQYNSVTGEVIKYKVSRFIDTYGDVTIEKALLYFHNVNTGTFPNNVNFNPFTMRVSNYFGYSDNTWKILTYTPEETNPNYYLNYIPIKVPEELSYSYQYGSMIKNPIEMSKFKVLDSYSDTLAVAKIKINNGLYGLVNSQGELVLYPYYSDIIY